MVVARALGPSGRGDVALLLAIPALTSYLASLGAQEANANLGGSEPHLLPKLVANSVLLAGVLGTAAAGLVAAAVALEPAIGGEVDRGLLWLSLATVPVLLLRLYLNLLIQSSYRFKATNQAWIVGPALTASVNTVLALTGVLSVGSALGIWILGQIAGCLILLRTALREFGIARVDVALARRSLGFGVRIHVGRFMEVGNYRGDQWLIGSLVGSRELGLYSVAVAWAELLFYVPGVIVLLQRPDLVRAPTPAAAAAIAARVFRRAAYLALGAGLVLLVAAPVLCTVAFGDAFAGSVDDLRVLALGALGIVALELLNNALVSQRRPLLVAATSGSAFVTTIVLDLLLIPSLGGLGAAIATSVAYSVGGVVAAIVFTRALHARAADLVPRPQDLGWYWRKVRSGWAAARQGT
jgi:O-antigen/teichoic acid export membrane protein